MSKLNLTNVTIESRLDSNLTGTQPSVSGLNPHLDQGIPNWVLIRVPMGGP